MEGDLFSGLSNGNQVDGKVLQTFQKSFVQVQDILDQNRLLINEINQNHESKIPDNLTRNVGLIKELNNNIRRVVDLYADLSNNFTRSMEPSSEGESSGILKSNGKANSKRIRSGLLHVDMINVLCWIIAEKEEDENEMLTAGACTLLSPRLEQTANST
ncbi:hypothetical protein H0E87_002265 [Populus deltoides]|uniref:Protein EARLY FLOWERING 4 domain-containing protein n=1 Tax=Populus deltoides TaxID=3696 RepID=A0A8T2ZUY8_POPDE|nr:hypothetical protein H0E87_002265 [Populus deltoides]